MSFMKCVTSHATYYVHISNNIIRTIEYASRICYDANDKMTEDSWSKYIGARVRSGHESVIEHGCFTVIIEPACMDTGLEPFRDTLAYSNSLLHYIQESGWNPSMRSVSIASVSGNLKMWRDYFKYLINNKYFDKHEERENLEVLWDLIGLFKIFDSTCDGIFTSDFGKFRYDTENFKNGIISFIADPSIEFVERMEKNWDKTPMPNYELFDLIYRQNPVEIIDWDQVITREESGIEMKMINVDNIAREFGTVGNNVPNYIRAFIYDHVLDMGTITYQIWMPRIVTQQESRHRVNSISQRSQRYVDESGENTQIYTPPNIDREKEFFVTIPDGDDTRELKINYDDFMRIAMDFYADLVSAGVKKEDARNVLPGSIFSTMVITKPMYTLPHYFKERCSDRAQLEIREPARKLKEYLDNLYKFVRPNSESIFE